jgi:hypothetical protein
MRFFIFVSSLEDLVDAEPAHPDSSEQGASRTLCCVKFYWETFCCRDGSICAPLFNRMRRFSTAVSAGRVALFEAE